MQTVHELIIRPLVGQETETAETLAEMGAVMAREPGFVEGYTLDGLAEGGLLSRISVWQDRVSADKAAQLDLVIALREKLEALAEASTLAPLLDIMTERRAGEPIVA